MSKGLGGILFGRLGVIDVVGVRAPTVGSKLAIMFLARGTAFDASRHDRRPMALDPTLAIAILLSVSATVIAPSIKIAVAIAGTHVSSSVRHCSGAGCVPIHSCGRT